MINLSNVAKLLPKSEKPIIWYRTETEDYLFTGFWMFKTNKDLSKEKSISAALFKLFGQIPAVDSGLKINNKNEVVDQNLKDLKNIQNYLSISLGMDDLELTDLVYTAVINKKSNDGCILKGPKYYTVVDRDYINFIVLDSKFKLKCAGVNRGVYAISDYETLMILPIRIPTIAYLKPIAEDRN